jgi:alpha-galactosidase
VFLKDFLIVQLLLSPCRIRFHKESEAMPNPKIAFMGAGSTIFAQNLIGDILSYPELAGAELALHDIDQARLDVTEAVAGRVAQTLGVRPTVSATLERERALAGADFVINMIQVGGYKPATVTDFEIPKKYGLRQTIADTLGIGGIMRALRTVPVLLAMSRDMERLCPPNPDQDRRPLP